MSGGAGAVPIYWEKDWTRPYSCKLVNYQTAHSALVSGEYVDCVEEFFSVKIKEILLLPKHCVIFILRVSIINNCFLHFVH